ncbi:MAG: dienelactone hydrolase family protein [Mycobacteriales bacterium]|nr:dienelactone hydrolase family protein [Frankia sp.]
MGERIEIPANGAPLPAYIAMPDNGSGAGVVVVHEWWGLVPHIEGVADRLAAEGYVALAPDLWRGASTAEPDEARKLAMSAQLAEVGKDLQAAAEEVLRRSSRAGIGVIGFCMGGTLALHLAGLDATVRATVDYYGGPPAPDSGWSAERVHGAVLGHFSDHEHYSPAHLGRELHDAKVPVEFHIYPGTQHAFFNDDRREVYNADAADLSWRRTLDFLRSQLVAT